jgi:signal transduction histidine kinase
MSNLAASSAKDQAGRFRRLIGPRLALLLGVAALNLLLVATFAYVVVDSQALSRREAEQRFKAQATISAALTASLFSSSAASGQSTAAKAFGARTVEERVVNSFVARSRLVYALVLGSDGKLLVASRGTPAAVRARPAAAVRAALEGQPVLSDVVTAGSPQTSVVQWALPFRTPYGRRVEVQGFRLQLLSRFLGTTLARTRTDASGEAYVLDSRSHVVATSEKHGKAGTQLAASGLVGALAVHREGVYREQGAQRYFTSAPVDGSTWRVVVSQPTSRLYPALAGSRSWFLYLALVALGLVGTASFVFLRRALRNGAQLHDANLELSEVNATLEERVADRTAAAEERAKELARSNGELEQFASVTSHDLQEPLRKIRMFGNRLQAKLGDDLPEEAAADLERMQNAAQRMQRLIEDLLSFSRVTSMGEEFEPVDLNKVTEEVISDLEARVVELNARVEVGHLPVIEADQTQMRQLMQNLISNALKFHREGEPPLIRIRADVIAGQAARFSQEATAADRCVITVEDNGIGFEDKHAERVFAAFQRLHGRSAYEGTGIGLSIARKIVWRHGGDITAKSTPEQGSTFTVTLPLSHGNGSKSSNGSTRGDEQ